MTKVFLNNIGDLAEAQRASFYHFLYKGIKEELRVLKNPFLLPLHISLNDQRSFNENKNITDILNNIKDEKLNKIIKSIPNEEIYKITKKAFDEEINELRKEENFSIYLYIKDIKFSKPSFCLKEALANDLTYSSALYIKTKLVEPHYGKQELSSKDKFNGKQDLSSKIKVEAKKIREKFNRLKLNRIYKKHDILIGDIPLMTEEGSFIINGCERIVVSQIIRSPGVYFSKEFNTKRKATYTATVISDKGSWSKFILDEDEDKNDTDRLYLKLTDFSPKVSPVLIPFAPFAYEGEENIIHIYDLLKYFGLSFEEISDSSKYPSNFKKQEKNITILSDEIKEKYFFLVRNFVSNQRSGCFSIGEIGRYKINKKLGLNLPKYVTYLSAHDLIGIFDGLIELKYYKGISDDIDHIKNKQIRCVGELLRKQFRRGLYTSKKSGAILNDYRIISSVLKEFFITSQLSQLADQTNPLSEITHKRRISVFGPNGLKRDHISTVIRDIHPSQYGKLCPIETPEGQNAGLITSPALYGRISYLGWIETPYFLIENSTVFSEKSPIFLSPEEESNTSIAFCDFAITKENKIPLEYISTKENYSFSLKKSKDVNFITTSPLQIISLATSLIPFIEHDDANRALMGSNMQRQAVPLLSTQKPIVGTGFESIACLDSSMVTKSYSEGTVVSSDGNFIQIKDNSKQIITYELKKYLKSNQETCINQKPMVWNGEIIFSGQIIADGPSTLDGELSLGKNLTIAYMPWEGYNYEDAIVISERLISEDCLTSVHIQEYQTDIPDVNDFRAAKLTSELPRTTFHIRRHLDKCGIARIGSYVTEDEILAGKLLPCEPDQSGVAKFIRSILQIEAEPAFKDISLRVPYGIEGRIIDIKIIDRSPKILRFFIAKVRKIQIGDKLAGRHGNKGIISRVLSRQDMPYLPDGTPVDIILNPLGVPSRMNVGQVFECLLGLAGEKIGSRFKILPFDEIYGKEASRILVNQKLKEAALKTNTSWLFNNDSPGKILLRDGRTGEYFDNPITVGKSYILKLIHLVEDKIHARATGPYSMITEQPLAGKSQKGGQRFGEMEVWALEAHGCGNTLQELLTIKSDDMDGRNDVYEAIMVRKRKIKPNPSISESFLVLIRELNSLGLDFSMRKFQNGFYSTRNIKEIEFDVFKALETRLRLREHLVRQKAAAFIEKTTDLITNCDNEVENEVKKLYEKYKEEYEKVEGRIKLKENKTKKKEE